MRKLSSPLTLLLLLLAGGVAPLAADDGELGADNRFIVTGYGFTTYTDSDEGEETFNAGLSPILLYRVSDKFLFEAEIEFEFEDEGLETELEYAQVDWLANDNLTVVLGKFLSPFGSFIERLHPAWINKLPTAPLPFQHGQSVVPFSQLGLQLRGGVPLGDGYRRLTYSVYVSNGFQISEHEHGEEGEHEEEEGEHEEEEEEELLFFDGSTANDNGELAVGGRVSVVPARGFEFGVSYLSGSYDEAGTLDATTTGIDFTYHHDVFDLRAEWLDNQTDRVSHEGHPIEDQEVTAWYVQPSLHLSVIPAYFFNRLELVARLAQRDGGDVNTDQTSIGLNYYFNGSTILRLAWERTKQTGHESDNALHAMFAIGF